MKTKPRAPRRRTVMCYCGFAYRGRRCNALRKKHPGLTEGFWHRRME